MRRAEKAAKIGEILDHLYPEPPIPLEHRDPFTLLVAVLLSAQTTDVQVNKVTPSLFAKASTPKAMASLSVTGAEAPAMAKGAMITGCRCSQ